MTIVGGCFRPTEFRNIAVRSNEDMISGGAHDLCRAAVAHGFINALAAHAGNAGLQPVRGDGFGRLQLEQ